MDPETLMQQVPAAAEEKASKEIRKRADSEGHGGGTPSSVTFKGHPIHPILVAMPVTLLPAAFATDCAYLAYRDPFWPRASRLLLAAGFASGVASAATGLVDFLTISEVRSHKAGWIHFLGNAAALLVSAANLASNRARTRRRVQPAGAVLSALTTVLLVITGWFGGELVYRHRIGVSGPRRGQSGPEGN
jgi:uncharacterized membrane protein